jgi:hypothetical protein
MDTSTGSKRVIEDTVKQRVAQTTIKRPASVVPKKPTKIWVFSLITLVVVALIASGAFIVGARIHRNNTKNLNDVNVVQLLIAKHYLLPQGETPALITVTDVSKLTTPFLKESQDGDKILVYQNAKKVVIYRPSIDRIVDIGPVSVVPLDNATNSSN